MDFPGQNKLIVVTEDQIKYVRKSYNVDKQSLESAVDALITWYNQQPHLPPTEFDRDWMERLFIGNKCSLERAKSRLDMYYACINLMPDFFTNRDPYKAFTIGKNSIIMAILPKLALDNSRVSFVKVVNRDSENFDFLEFLKLIFMMHEYRRQTDYCIGDRYVTDMRGQTFGHMLKYHPGMLKRSELAVKKVYGHRIKGIHLVYTSPVMEKLIMLMKMVLTEKLSGRIQVHGDIESLYNIIPKDMIPKDYGGDEMSTEEIFESWKEELCTEKYAKWLQAQETMKSDESKRLGPALIDDMLGIQGSFRKLNVD